ncbi:ABC transporter substrate-binding protein [Shewanella sp. FJAT-52076]|uniref:substrate-binding periplasmic protein n=1 Tax=Shewanella sp. FJAT-52076 TaxID=2864202 RepID=UPI001C660D67|nr:ABC transporter substrate-binding protein [Shewanella sp. FJAT-52076]QYJ76802.1 ABC transporter substrate-binding protein [Shewanella sp. FJAT-52076]
MTLFRRCVTLLLLTLSCAITASAWATPKTVTVGGYSFPPYVVEKQGDYSGLVPELIDTLNRLQGDYEFVFVPTSIERRYEAFERRRFDVILFESPDWGWQQIPKAVLPLGILDSEVFVGRSPEANSEGFFTDLAQRRLLLVRGYHYRFAGFNSDEHFLRTQFLAELVPDTRAAVEGLLLGRADVAPISQAYISYFQRSFPDKAQKLVVSTIVDQQYKHTALIHPQSPLDLNNLQALFGLLESSGELARLLSEYRLSREALVSHAGVPQ